MGRKERLADLKAKLAARERTPGFEINIIAVKEEIARLEGALPG